MTHHYTKETNMEMNQRIDPQPPNAPATPLSEESLRDEAAFTAAGMSPMMDDVSPHGFFIAYKLAGEHAIKHHGEAIHKWEEGLFKFRPNVNDPHLAPDEGTVMIVIDKGESTQFVTADITAQTAQIIVQEKPIPVGDKLRQHFEQNKTSVGVKQSLTAVMTTARQVHSERTEAIKRADEILHGLRTRQDNDPAVRAWLVNQTNTDELHTLVTRASLVDHAQPSDVTGTRR
jgi:hypothetical protein